MANELLRLSKTLTFDQDTIESPDLTDCFSREDLDRLGEWVYNGYRRDRMSRSHWERRQTAAMELAIQLQKMKNFPWPGCSSVAFPLVTIGALQFSANSYANIIQGQDVVGYRVIGDDRTGQLAQRASRVGQHMSWQVLEQDQAWEEQHDRLLINLSVVGTAFVKTYYDVALGYPVGEWVSAQDLVVDYWAKSLETAQRKSQRISLFRNEIYERVQRGVFRKGLLNEQWYESLPTLPESSGQHDLRSGLSPIEPDADSPFPFIEQHRFLDLDGDGYAEPYTVTVEERSHCVCRLVARVKNPDAIDRTTSGRIIAIPPAEHYVKYPFIPNPDGGFYDLGYGVLLGPMNESVSSIINQMIDNGTLHNLSGGFIGRGMKIRGGDYTMSPFELKRVDSTGDDIKKNLVLFEPNDTPEILFKLMLTLIEYASRISGATDTVVGENPGQNTPASTYQGLQERGMNLYSWIFKRIWRAMKDEFRQRYEINSRSLRRTEYFGQDNLLVYAEDYRGDPDQIAPVADPNLPSTNMRIQQAVFVANRALAVPGYDHEEVERAVLRAVRAPNPKRLYPGIKHTAPLPNPKLQIEQLKLQAKSLELKHQQMEWANKLMEERRLNDAKILQLRAQSAKLIADTNVDQAELKLKSLELQLDALQQYSSHLTERIGALSAITGPEGGDSQRSGVGGLATPSGDASVSGDALEGAGASEGDVGDGSSGGNGELVQH